MNTLTVVNIKCGGCEKKIIDSLKKSGLAQIAVDVEHQQVSFEGDADIARKTLTQIGYPEAGTAEAASVLEKAHSYLSCALGRIL